MPSSHEGADHAGAFVLLDQIFDLGTLGATRRAIQGCLPTNELTEPRAGGFLAAINEGLINAIQHGGGSGTVRLLRTAERLIAVVEDIRPTTPFDLPQAPPPHSAERG